MFTMPNVEEVLDDLGDKAVSGLRESVDKTVEDLAEYRKLKPDWVAEHSERGLANWIHDRLWQHLVELLSEHPDVDMRDREPKREIFFGLKYRMRVKRQTPEGFIRNYPTQGALDFEIQIQATLPGLEEVRLYAGYVWDASLRSIGSPVLSLHDGQDEVVWVAELLDPGNGQGRVRQIFPASDGPSAPIIEMPKQDKKLSDDSESDSQ